MALGFVLRDWAKPYWSINMDHTIEPCNDGNWAVVCWELQTTVFVAETREECIKFLGDDPLAENQEKIISDVVDVGIFAGLTVEQMLLLIGDSQADVLTSCAESRKTE